jgi:hypothetical protein
MRELPDVGDRVRIPFWPGTIDGYVSMVQDFGIDLQIMVNIEFDFREEPFRVMCTRDQVEVIEPRKPFVEPIDDLVDEVVDEPIETA